MAQRLSYLLYPYSAAMGGLAFEIDENPSAQAAARDCAAWFTGDGELTTPATMDGQPDTVAIWICDLIANTDAVRLGVDIRMDALICTRAADGGTGYATWTGRYADIQENQRLTLENALLYRGPVRDFVDIAMFVSRDRTGSPDLETLLAERTSNFQFREASTAQVTAGATRTALITAVGGGAALAGISRELLRSVAGESMGVYRTSYLRAEQFGSGRHPGEGLYRTRLLSFSVVTEITEPAPS